MSDKKSRQRKGGMPMTEKLLFQAFDLQRFEGNARLQSVIDRAHARIEGRELSDDELDLVAAAGAPQPPKKNVEKML